MAERTTPAVRIKRPVEPREQPSLFGPRPLIEGEDAAAYDELLARFSAVIKPKDVLEEMWLRDIVDLTWETMRMRRLKAGLLTSVTWEGLKEVFLKEVFFDAATTRARYFVDAPWCQSVVEPIAPHPQFALEGPAAAFRG